ncbi:ABC transporter substrate-binding protein [Paenibacillus glucanolyticus]|jgi:multiple sugar transport system substrate-binding protein|uniref:ABC transporter substrate-binding protein n=1 Tax=Paenibacillus TaxID=44249 RepID=UPI0003E2AE12|nr:MULTISPECIES: ABC transporter substrate-binding protein [Paenibacillus]ANA81112.1 ABC transporter substrate-binding protein [Paenibacillus glucanolyticus]AVV54769.1 ABC transporter substrate-binding protein [Paenibacillus glucanolyticus]ETT33720.1 family 1 extracellular solute-binding protein [Paenibacillus sp. FSL R5-808]MPY18948.1 ABC transporter substrate-binding protein [Paenibacillus glucanolyticus]OMF74391.1 ABC transporter substrate-binding protein [Paenibacillus glucanolyticus]
MKNRGWVLLLTVLCFSLVFTACTGASEGQNAGGNSSNGGKLTYWYPWGGDSEKWDQWRMDEFTKEYPDIEFNATYVPPDGGISNGKLLAAISGGNPPDVVITNEYASAYALAAQGALMPIDDLLAATDFKEDEILDAYRDLMKVEGTTYLFPEDSNVNLLYYNVDLFKEAGLDPDQPPQTIEELDAAAEQLTKLNGDKIDRLGFIPWLDAGDESYMWGYIFGADYYDTASKQVKLDDPHLIEMYNWMNTYAQKYNPEKIKSFSSGFGGAFSPDHPFFSGKVAMTINGNWFSNALKQYAPNVNYKVAAIPAPDGGRKNSSNFGTNIFMIPKGAKNSEAAMKFILFGVKPEIMADNINQWRSLSIYKEQNDAIKWDKEGDEIYKIVREVASSPDSGHPALTAVAKEMSNELMLLRDSVIYNNHDPQPLLQAAQKKLQEEVDKKK